jgi:heptosyltransferase-2
MKDKVAADCRFFSGESPCVFHKQYGVKCGDCQYYNPVVERILIIKMGAKGDVLRTTCILTGLKEKYPDSYVTWVVEKGSQELLRNVKIPFPLSSPQIPLPPLLKGDEGGLEKGKGNSYTVNLIDRVLEFSIETFVILQAEKFDLVLSLDSSVVSAGLAERINADEKKGFGLDREGKIYPFNPEAEEWFRMGIFDDLKRKNKKTYQEIILEIAGISTKNYEIIVNLTDEEKEFARDFSKEKGIDGSSPIIGLNTGAGSRWQLKKWTLDGYLELIKRLHEELSARVLLFGAGEEKERNQWLKENSPYPVIDTGSGNTLREFFALLNLCDIIAVGDTLAVHAAVGLRKKVVVLFGPTSPSEIELYGKGEKIIAPVDCIGCYRQSCDREPSCMDLITIEAVFDAILRLLRR